MGVKCDLTQTVDLLGLLNRFYMGLKLASEFEIAPFSDLDYEGMTVEIKYKGAPIAQVNKDKGFESFEIEIPSRFSPEVTSFTFPVNDLIQALIEAKNLLSQFE
jgi:hypothetical protein